MGIGNSIINGTNHLDNSTPKPKLIIHETDCHGCGMVYYNGNIESYAYDDNADVKNAVQILIEVGAINENDVVIVREDEIYKKLADLLEIEEAYYDKIYEDMDADYGYEIIDRVCIPLVEDEGDGEAE